MAASQVALGTSSMVPNLPAERGSRGSGRPTAPLPTRNRGLISVKFQRSITINFCTNTYVTAIGRLGKLATIWRSARVGLVRARRTCLLRHRPSETLSVASRHGGIRMSPFERRDVHDLDAQPVGSGPACDQPSLREVVAVLGSVSSKYMTLVIVGLTGNVHVL